jgi:sterol desaturase/sphingolipid hydroxylase (fatty acid hydroxylase superfamily)
MSPKSASAPILFLLVLISAFYGLRVLTQVYPFDQGLLKWDRLVLMGAVILLERIYHYRYAVSQRAVLKRDVFSNIVNLYVNGFVTGLIVLPLLAFLPEHFLGRKWFFASSEQLGPVWLQVAMIAVFVSFFRYWMHRLQHENQFLWNLHSYHHQVTDLKAFNSYVSHPIDYSLRNIVVYFILGVVGFSPLAILIAVPLTFIGAAFSHCGADLKGGFLNYLFVTPEVHRWHHAAEVPEGYGYSCNYGVEFPVWDMLFGTFYLPQKDGQTLQPERIGHPGGVPDEPSYLRLLLTPLGLWPRSWTRLAPGTSQAESAQP